MTKIAEKMTQSSSHTGSPDVVNAISEAIQAVEDALPNFGPEHLSAQYVAEVAHNEIGECGSYTVHGTAATSQYNSILTSKRNAMNTAHTTLGTAQTTKTNACNQWRSYAHGVVPNRPVCSQYNSMDSDTAVANQFYQDFQDFKRWIDDNNDDMVTKWDACRGATTDETTSQTAYDNAVTDYEEAFCDHKQSCDYLRACQLHHIGVYQTTKENLEDAMTTRHDQYQSIRQVECLLGLINTAMRTNTTISEADLGPCHGTFDVSDLTLSFPAIPVAQVCPAAENDDPPCSNLATFDSAQFRAALCDSEWESKGKGCGQGYSVSCLNGNTAYDTLADAWTQCEQVSGCGAIHATANHKYYLRRITDPDNTATTSRVLRHCAGVSLPNALVPWCSNGLRAGGVCCAASCGSCGGHNCHLRPGGADQCCEQNILAGSNCNNEQDDACRIPSSSFSISYEIEVTVSGNYPSLLTGPLQCDGTQTVVSEGGPHSDNCEPKHQCLVEVNTDCAVRTRLRDRCQPDLHQWTDVVSGGTTDSSGRCTITLGATALSLN
jgi:hypothetical protein